MAKPIAVLDAGHGGKDSGTCAFGRKEKDDNLDIVKSIGSKLKPYVTVKYTRTTDVYESPTAKANKADALNADLFISCHRNCSDDSSGNGYETLVYANNGDKKEFADFVNEEMEKIGFKNRGTKIRTDLAVLRKPSMPCVLPEIGFVSSQRDNTIFEDRFELISDAITIGALLAAGTIRGTKGIKKTCAYNKTVTVKKDCPVRSGRAQSKKKIATIKKGDEIKVWYILKNSVGNMWGSVVLGNGKVGFIYMGNCKVS